MLEIRKLSCGYGEHPIISQLDLSVPEGSLTVIVGPNGCGKSTLLKAITGILPFSGSILFQNQPLAEISSDHRAKLVGFLPQSRPVPEITAEKLVLHGRFPYLTYPRHYRTEDRAAARSAMEQLSISHLADRSLPSLSGGERQKVYLAMQFADRIAVMNHGEILTCAPPNQLYESGTLEDVFRVRVEQLATMEGFRYCFLPKDSE